MAEASNDVNSRDDHRDAAVKGVALTKTSACHKIPLVDRFVREGGAEELLNVLDKVAALGRRHGEGVESADGLVLGHDRLGPSG